MVGVIILVYIIFERRVSHSTEKKNFHKIFVYGTISTIYFLPFDRKISSLSFLFPFPFPLLWTGCGAEAGDKPDD